MKKRKVLMLGWNDASVRHSGIGVACRGLCSALSRTEDITLIVPTSEVDLDLRGVSFISTEGDVVQDSAKSGGSVGSTKHAPQKTRQGTHEIIELPIDLDPYYFTKQDSTLVRELRSKPRSMTSAISGSKEVESQDDDSERDDLLAQVMDYAKKVTEIAKGLEFDIIHAHDWMTFLAGIYVSNQNGKPLVLHIHSLDYDRTGTGNKTWVFNIERYALSKADMVISVSDYTSGIIFSRYGLSSRKVVTVHNGVDRIKTYRQPSGYSGKTVLFVGRITGQKGPKYFLQVALKVLQMYRDVRFVMVGVGDALEEIMNTEAFRQLEDRIDLKGFLPQDELYEVYASADVLCLPSVSEPFGLVALEAIQFGVPVVLSNRAGVGEILHSALKADYWDIDLIANHVVALMTDERLKKMKVEEGMKELKNVSWEKAAAQVGVVYTRVLSR